jgi:hypothetical protein
MGDEPFDREAYALELLKCFANGGEFDGDQMGPDQMASDAFIGSPLSSSWPRIQISDWRGARTRRRSG